MKVRNLSTVALLVLASSIGQAVASEDPVLVRWRDQVLTKSDYEAALQSIPAKDRYDFQTNMRRITDLLNNLLLTRTLAAEGRALGLDKDPLIQKEMQFAADRLLAVRRLEAFEKGLKVPDMTAAAEEAYKVKPQDFRVNDQVHVAHVLIHRKGRTPEEARARAEEVRSKALKGADFAQLAKEYSDDPSSEVNQGDLGLFGRGRMVRQFEDAAFALEKAGEISQVVDSPFGFHVIKLIEKKPGRQKSFAEVKDELIAQLTEKYIKTERSRYLSGITSDKSIVIESAEVDKLKKDVPTIPVSPLPARKDASAAK